MGRAEAASARPIHLKLRAKLISHELFNPAAESVSPRFDISYAMTISDLPAINASLNFVSTIFISWGWYLIRRGHWRRHRLWNWASEELAAG